MIAYRTTIDLENNLVYLKLPENFNGKKVEIIVLETAINSLQNKEAGLEDIPSFFDSFNIIDDDNPEVIYSEPNEFQKILLNAPNWDNQNYNQFKEIRRLFNKWKI